MLAGVANASPVGGVTVVVDPAVDVGGGLRSYTVHLKGNTAADTVGGWDGGFTGGMNQVKYLGVLDTPTLTYGSPAQLGTDSVKDSHFLFLTSDLLPSTGPSETASTLSGVFSLNSGVRNQDLIFAQIVLPAGQTVQLVGEASDVLGNNSYSVNQTIPEPLSLTVLAIGACACLRRRMARGTN